MERQITHPERRCSTRTRISPRCSRWVALAALTWLVIGGEALAPPSALRPAEAQTPATRTLHSGLPTAAQQRPGPVHAPDGP